MSSQISSVLAEPDSSDNPMPTLEFTYAGLPERFYERTRPTPVAKPRLIKLNLALAERLGLNADRLRGPEGLDVLSGSRIPDDMQAVAQAYAGHQFGNFVPQLGDGRALLLGEAVDADGVRRDLQLKGSGPTRFSRGGDGRAAVGPVLREYIVSEAMHALGIPTTRSLAAVATGEPVYREHRLPGAVLTRVAASHIRIGTFQYFAARGDTDGIRTLADYAINRHYPEAAGDQPYLRLLESVIAAQARLVARWMLVGFIHGVMNTDNMTISGETIDYGPCAFMDAFDPNQVFSSIDQKGRYAFANQPNIAVWNLARFAETLLPLLHEDLDEAVKIAEGALKTFRQHYEPIFHGGLREKLGLATEEDEDVQLISDLFALMASQKTDFTLTFRGLGGELDGRGDGARALFSDPAAFDQWAERWHARIAREPQHDAGRLERMRAANPKYIPRNHRIEEAIRAAEDRGDFAPFEDLVAVLAKPFDEQPDMARYAAPPEAHEQVLRTFCGT